MSQAQVSEEALLADPTTPYWLRKVIVETRTMDPVDVLAEVEVLLAICQQRHAAVLRESDGHSSGQQS